MQTFLNGSLFLENNSGVTGAIHLHTGTITIEENLIVSDNIFTNVGAVYLPNAQPGFSTNTFLVKGDVEFNNNQARRTPALRNWTDDTTIEGNATFTDNTSTEYDGGAVSTWKRLTINGDVTFINNRAMGTGAIPGAIPNGGALQVNGDQVDNASETFTTFNGDALFEDNLAGRSGGAIYSRSSNELVLNVLKSDLAWTGNEAHGGGTAATASAGGFLYAGVNGTGPTTTGFNVGAGKTLSIGTCDTALDSIASADNTAILNKKGPGVLTMKSDNSFFLGKINVQGGTLQAGCDGSGASAVPVLSPDATYAVASGAVLSANGFDGHAVGALENSGTVRTGSANSAPGVELVVGNDYDGTSGSTLVLNADLSANPISDYFSVWGATTGMTGVKINRISGGGAATTGNGILVVQTHESDPQNYFTMTPFVVGSFRYSLVAVNNNLYLQSAPYVAPVTSTTAIPLAPAWMLLALAGVMGFMGRRRLKQMV